MIERRTFIRDATPSDQTAPVAVSAVSPITVLEADANDRRRPGRVEHIHPSLIGLLRKPDDGREMQEGAPILTTDMPANDLSPTMGVAAAAAIGLLMWALAIFGGARAVLVGPVSPSLQTMPPAGAGRARWL